MWIFTRDGFVSLVQHDDNPDIIRARGRRKEHLVDTFDLADQDVLDYGADAPDYRWHADIPRLKVAAAVTDALMDLDYTSHVKEEVSGPDNQMHAAMMRCWSALLTLQYPDRPAADWWTPPLPVNADDEMWYAVDPTDDDLADATGKLAQRMLASIDREDGEFPDLSDEPAWADDPLPVKVWGTEEDTCLVCDGDLATGDEIVTLPEDSIYNEPEGPAHAACAEDVGWKVSR